MKTCDVSKDFRGVLIRTTDENEAEKAALKLMNGYASSEWAEYDDEHWVIYLTTADYWNTHDNNDYRADKYRIHRQLKTA